MPTFLNLSSNYLTDVTISSIAQIYTGLLEFDISFNVKLTDESLFTVAEGCRQLQTLNVYGCRELTLKTESALYMRKFLTNLRKLGSGGLQIPDVADLRNILENWRNLKSLTLDRGSTRTYQNKLHQYFPNTFLSFIALVMKMNTTMHACSVKEY
jgi:hypothetical protein